MTAICSASHPADVLSAGLESFIHFHSQCSHIVNEEAEVKSQNLNPNLFQFKVHALNYLSSCVFISGTCLYLYCRYKVNSNLFKMWAICSKTEAEIHKRIRVNTMWSD